MQISTRLQSPRSLFYSYYQDSISHIQKLHLFLGKSPVEEHPTDPIPNTLMASFNTDTSLDTTPDKPNEDELTGLEDDSKLEKLNRALVESNKNDIMRLEGKINLIKTLHRLEESRRKHQQYAALLKAGKITNYDWMFQHRRSNDLSPMKSLQLVADSKSKVSGVSLFMIVVRCHHEAITICL